MGDERDQSMNVNEQASSVEATDRGLFDFMKKTEGQAEDHQKPPQEEKFASEFDQKVQVSEPEYVHKAEGEAPKEEEKKHGSFLEKLHRSDSSSSSSSDEEEDDEEKKRRRKEKKEKGLKEKIKEKLPGHKDDDTNVPIEKCDEKPQVQEVAYSEPSHPAQTAHQEEDLEKKGFLDKIKEKLPGKKGDGPHDAAVKPVAAAPAVAAEPCADGDKKGFLEKIKEKIPGFHSKNGEEKKECEEKKESH